MKGLIDNGPYLVAAIVLALAGIFEVIDQASMITLIVVLTVLLPGYRRSCGRAKGQGA